jgi:hypothetical protein
MPDEKFDEKEREKREEKSPDEKWRNDPLGTLIFALVLIWAGIVLLLENLGTLDQWTAKVIASTGWTFLADHEPWQYITLGAGLLVVIEIILRLLVPAYRRSVLGSIIWAVILIGIGLGGWVNWNILWPLIIILLGLSIIFRGVFRKSEPKA